MELVERTLQDTGLGRGVFQTGIPKIRLKKTVKNKSMRLHQAKKPSPWQLINRRKR